MQMLLMLMVLMVVLVVVMMRMRVGRSVVLWVVMVVVHRPRGGSDASVMMSVG